MLKGFYMKRLWLIVGAAIALLIGGINVKAVKSEGGVKEMLSSAVIFGTKENFNKFIETEFKKSKYADIIDYSKTVSIVASPASKVVSIKDIEKGAIVGGVYLSSGSLKYNLSPGDYAVRVMLKGTLWFAQFLDKKGKIAQEVSATVYPGKSVDQILVSLRYSICYIIDGAIVCI